MSFLKVILKYSGLLMLSGWMFFMGLLVGRDTAPVDFDTGWFQERLAVIFDDSKPDESVLEKPDLDFYAALKKSDLSEDYDLKLKKSPIAGDIDGIAASSKSASLSEELEEDIDTNDLEKPLKKSRKAMTFKLHEKKTPSVAKNVSDGDSAVKSGSSDSSSSYVAAKYLAAKRLISMNKTSGESGSSDKEHINDSNSNKILGGSGNTVKNQEPVTISARSDKTKVSNQVAETKSDQIKEYVENVYSYTIQIASFPTEADALTHIAKLGEKGYSAYKSSGMVGEKTWYRIRIGSFNNITEAKESLKKLESSGIKGLIIQKD
ncbi:MAG: SPOR domain-containing protein [Desulfamplus sp.]|nr:SPOR domain-containing protein [Desulfamplus sp.]